MAAPTVSPTGALIVSPPTGFVAIAAGPQASQVKLTSGVFTLNGSVAVTVADANVTATSMILVTLKTVGGTVGAIPVVQTITPGVGFTILGTTSDSSIYNYLILG